VIGADRRQLVFQFTGETVLVSLIAIALAVIGYNADPAFFKAFTPNPFLFAFHRTLTALAYSGGALFIGIISGIYPALVMSGFQPIKVLKGLKARAMVPALRLA
jgi:putative ABC transport system permease protein